MDEKTKLVLHDILNKEQVVSILKQSIGDNVAVDLKASEVRPAMDGLAGFLGDHMKAVLYVDVEGEENQVCLFVKRIPTSNKPKGDFIDEHHYFRREQLVYKVLEEICRDGPKPWCVKAYIYTDSIMVMPDITLEGYTTKYYLYTLDVKHVFVTTTSIACFHAAFVNYETKKSIDLKCTYTTSQEFDVILQEPTFLDSPWLTACSKLSADLTKAFSTKAYRNMSNLQSKLIDLYIKACDTLREYKDTVNVLIHKDLWVNNIMFKYENDVPVNAVLVDYQCTRYAPPAFDLMIFLYLTTDSRFRDVYEKDVFDHYYSVFVNELTEDSKKRLNDLGYDKEDFLNWCEISRMFGILEAIAIYPFILLDPKTAEKTFDNPETFEKHINIDRSEPVLAHANKCEVYKDRNLAITEEFIETYLLTQL